MKMVMLTYNEAVEIEIMEVMSACGVQNYSKIGRTYGKGATSGTHLGNDVWPGLNNILYVACDNAQADEIVSSVNKLRKTIGKEGVKAFVMPLEQITQS
jgi:nitrogen regulatory protein PII